MLATSIGFGPWGVAADANHEQAYLTMVVAAVSALTPPHWAWGSR